MKKCSHYICLAVLCSIISLASCIHSKAPKSDTASTTEDKLIDMLEVNPLRMISMVDSLNELGELTETKANYFKAQAYYRQGQDLTAELCYKHALSSNELYEERPVTYYFACDQLSTILTCKGDDQGSLDIATKGYAKAREESSAAGMRWAASLQHDIAYSQMRLNHDNLAEKNFKQAYTTLRQLASKEDDFDLLYAWARVAYNILDAYTSSGHFDKAALWIDSVEVAINKMAASPECPPQKAEEYLGSFYTHQASILSMTGHEVEADKVYEKFMQLDYAHTNLGLIDNAEYLEMSKRWNDRANLTPSIDSLLKAWDMPLSLYYLRAYQVPNFKAYLNAGRHKEALQTALKMAENMDSIEDYERKHNAAELSIIFETQEKELKIAEQQAQLRYQRMIALAIASLLLVIFLAIFIYFRHRAALKLAEKNRELERKNRELIVANARVEDSSRMKTNFIQQISHEIRTPLNILSGYTQVLTSKSMTVNDATRQEANEKIMESSNRIIGLVNKMLELSDSNSQAVIEMDDDVSPKKIATMAVANSGIDKVTKFRFELKINSNIDKQMLHTNERQAVRALELLLDNAQKFTKQGNVVLSVNETSERQIAFAVEDTGIGVPVYEAERIFNEFVQLDEFADGTGIGLAVARSIARRLGGDIVLDTSYRKGARFIMTLPQI